MVRVPMIDAHLHVAPPQLPGAGSLSPILKRSIEDRASSLRREMRAAGITAAFAMPQIDQPPDDPLGIASTLAACELVPGLRPIGYADPTKGDDPEHFRRVATELSRKRIVAFKVYLGYLHYEPSHANYRRYYELAAAHKLPVIFHTGDTYSAYAKLKYSHPLGVDEVAVDHPNVNFVIAHLGNPWSLDAAEVVYKNVNVWADLSGLMIGDESVFSDEQSRDLRQDLVTRISTAVRYCERPNRLLFGSDWPLIPIGPYREFTAKLIPTTWHDQFFTENAQRLFGVA